MKNHTSLVATTAPVTARAYRPRVLAGYPDSSSTITRSCNPMHEQDRVGDEVEDVPDEIALDAGAGGVTRRRMMVAASGSVGEMIAPRTKAGAQPRLGMSA